MTTITDNGTNIKFVQGEKEYILSKYGMQIILSNGFVTVNGIVSMLFDAINGISPAFANNQELADYISEMQASGGSSGLLPSLTGTYSIKNSSGLNTITSGAKFISILNDGASDALVDGVVLSANESQTFPYCGGTYGAHTYDAQSSTLKITIVR